MDEIERIVAQAAAAGMTLTRAQAESVAAGLAGMPAARRAGAALAFEDEPAGFLAALADGKAQGGSAR